MVELLLFLFLKNQELARPMPFFELFHDLLELRTELASISRKEDGRDTKTDDSVESACEYTLAGMLCLRSRSDEKRCISF